MMGLGATTLPRTPSVADADPELRPGGAQDPDEYLQVILHAIDQVQWEMSDPNFQQQPSIGACKNCVVDWHAGVTCDMIKPNCKSPSQPRSQL